MYLTKTRHIFCAFFVLLCVSCTTLPHPSPEYIEPEETDSEVATLSGKIKYYAVYALRFEVIAVDEKPLGDYRFFPSVKLLPGKHKIDVKYGPFPGTPYWATLDMLFLGNHDYQLQFKKLDGERKAKVPILGELSFPRRQVCIFDKTQNIVTVCEEAYTGKVD